MSDLYRPSNGTEGDSFIAAWCGSCARDRALREGCPIEECDDDECCDIIGRTMRYQIHDPEYPPEWCYDEQGRAKCTAYIPDGQPIPPKRCDKTIELF